MNIKLETTDAILLNKFQSLRTLRDVSELLEIKYNHLIYWMYRCQLSSYYTEFDITKHNGKKRHICASHGALKIIQSKLCHILNLIYAIRAKSAAHGFVVDKNIVTNANAHIKKRLVLNIDLKDFFNQINYGRVFGMFNKPPYFFPKDVAALLAKMCCYENKLPQGAPTSPIVSNLICRSLDRELMSLANTHRLTYTRYADDITYSTTRKKFPEDILKHKEEVVLGNKLINIIKENGFEINYQKVRLQQRIGRQVVTGLVVNNCVNLRRKYIRQVRAMLNAWEKHGFDNAQTKYNARYSKINNVRPNSDFKKVVKGKIDFIKMVKGQKHPIYRRLLNKYNLLINPNAIKLPLNSIEEIEQHLWILEDEEMEKGQQGTAFMLENVGLITCAHVLRGGEKTLKAFKHDATHKKVRVKILKSNVHCDLAILKLEGMEGTHVSGLAQACKGIDLIRTDVTLAGFPNYREGDFPTIRDSKVLVGRVESMIQKYTVNANIYPGESGGPVLNKENKVIGIIATGLYRDKHDGALRQTENNSFILISEIEKI